MNPFEMEVSDDELIYQMRLKDDFARELLMKRYTPFIKSWIKECLKGFPSYSYDKNDAMQQCWIAFFDAIEAYWAESGVFYTFAKLCVSRQLYSLLRSSKTNGFLSPVQEVSMNVPLYEETNETLEDRLESNHMMSHPKDYYLLREVLDIVYSEESPVLTLKEKKAIQMKLDGYSTAEIGAKLRLTAKAADNIVRKGRKKLQEHVKEDAS